MTETENYLNNCKYVKGALMLLVILGHSMAFWTNDWFTLEEPVYKSKLIEVICNWIGSFHTFTFVTVSGYIFAFKVLMGGYRNYADYLKNKFNRLIVPYITVTLIWLIPVSVYLYGFERNFFIQRFLLGIYPEQLWFLWMLFWIFVFVWPLKNVLQQRAGWIIVITMYVIGIFGIHRIPNIFCIWNAFQYIPMFYLGIRIRINQENGQHIKSGCGALFALINIVLYCILLNLNQSDGMVYKLINLILPVCLHMSGALMAFIGLQWIFQKKEKRFFSEKISEYSFPMYLFHQQLIYFTIFLFNGKINPYINILYNFIVAVGGSILISLFFKHWRITRMLIGEQGHLQTNK